MGMAGARHGISPLRAAGSGKQRADSLAQAPRRASRPAPSSSPILAGGEAATAHSHSHLMRAAALTLSQRMNSGTRTGAHTHLMRAAALPPWQPEAATAHSHSHSHSHSHPPLLPPAAPSTPPPQAPLFHPAHPLTRTQQPRARRRAAPRVPGARPAAGKERPGSGRIQGEKWAASRPRQVLNRRGCRVAAWTFRAA